MQVILESPIKKNGSGKWEVSNRAFGWIAGIILTVVIGSLSWAGAVQTTTARQGVKITEHERRLNSQEIFNKGISDDITVIREITIENGTRLQTLLDLYYLK